MPGPSDKRQALLIFVVTWSFADKNNRGLGAAVTDTLVADAIRRGVEVIFLSADNDAVARVYERVGFQRIGTACTAMGN